MKFDQETLIKRDIQANLSSKDPHAPSEQETNSTIQGVIESVIDNIRIHIENIHIRFEFLLNGSIMSVGVVIQDLSVYSRTWEYIVGYSKLFICAKAIKNK